MTLLALSLPMDLPALWGTLAVALFVFEDQLKLGSRVEQIVVQIEGITLVFIWAIGSSALFFNLLNRFVPLRVPTEQEAWA